MSLEDARLDRLRLLVTNAIGRHKGKESASYDLEYLVDSGELTIRDVEWLIDRARAHVSEPVVATGPISWHVKLVKQGVVTITMQSSVGSSMWLSMYVDREGWEAIKAAGDAELAEAEQLPPV